MGLDETGIQKKVTPEDLAKEAEQIIVDGRVSEPTKADPEIEILLAATGGRTAGALEETDNTVIKLVEDDIDEEGQKAA